MIPMCNITKPIPTMRLFLIFLVGLGLLVLANTSIAQEVIVKDSISDAKILTAISMEDISS